MSDSERRVNVTRRSPRGGRYRSLATLVRRLPAGRTIVLAAVLVAGVPATAGAATSLVNPSLETGSGATPDCWTLGGYGSNSYSWTHTTDAHTGAYAEKLSVSSFSSGDRKLVSKQDTGACAPTAVPGHRYAVTEWYKATTRPVMFAYYRDSSGRWQYWSQSSKLPAGSSWTQASWTTPSVPSGATAISVGLGLKSAGTLTMDDFSSTDTAAPAPAPTPAPTPSPTPTPTPAPTSTPAPAPTPAPTPSPTPTPAPAPSGSLFTETFNSPLCSPDTWGTPDWISNPCPQSAWTSDASSSVMYSDPSSGRPDNVGATKGNTDMQRWYMHNAYSGNVKVSADVKPIGWDSNAAGKSTWAGWTFYVRRELDQTASSFYDGSPYVYNGQVHIEKKCVGNGMASSSDLGAFETGTVNGLPYKYYLLGNANPGTISMGNWHHFEMTAVDNSDGSVTLTLSRDGQTVLTSRDYPGLTACAPLTGSGRYGWRSDSAQYEQDNFTLSQLP